MKKKEVLLDIENLDVFFATRRKVVRAVDGVSLKIYKGERFGLAGESGSGKTTIANHLKNRLLERDYTKNITILDGDVVRQNLSKGLLRLTDLIYFLSQNMYIIFDINNNIHPKSKW